MTDGELNVALTVGAQRWGVCRSNLGYILENRMEELLGGGNHFDDFSNSSQVRESEENRLPRAAMLHYVIAIGYKYRLIWFCNIFS